VINVHLFSYEVNSEHGLQICGIGNQS